MSRLVIVVFGDNGSGKSTSIIKFITGDFIADYDPIIEDSHRKQIEINKKFYLADILDTIGTQDYHCLYDSWIREGNGFIILFSLTSRESFDRINFFYKNILRIREKKLPLILIGNKCDLENEIQVPIENIEELSNTLQCKYFITSAKESININEAFMYCFNEIIQYNENTEEYKNVNNSVSNK